MSGTLSGLLTPFFFASTAALLGCAAARRLRRAPIDEIAVHWLALVFACTFLYALVVFAAEGFTWPWTLLLPLAAPLLVSSGSGEGASDGPGPGPGHDHDQRHCDEPAFHLIAGAVAVGLSALFGWGLAAIVDELIGRGMGVISAISLVFSGALLHALAGLLALRTWGRLLRVG